MQAVFEQAQKGSYGCLPTDAHDEWGELDTAVPRTVPDTFSVREVGKRSGKAHFSRVQVELEDASTVLKQKNGVQRCVAAVQVCVQTASVSTAWILVRCSMEKSGKGTEMTGHWVRCKHLQLLRSSIPVSLP